MGHGHGEKLPRGIGFRGQAVVEAIHVFLVLAGRHHEEIADAHRLEIVGDFGRGVSREIFKDRVVDIDLPLRLEQTDGGRGETFAERKKHMRIFGCVRRPPTFGDNPPVTHDHEAVNPVGLGFECIDQRGDSGGGDALGFRRAAGQRRAQRGDRIAERTEDKGNNKQTQDIHNDVRQGGGVAGED